MIWLVNKLKRPNKKGGAIDPTFLKYIGGGTGIEPVITVYPCVNHYAIAIS